MMMTLGTEHWKERMMSIDLSWMLFFFYIGVLIFAIASYIKITHLWFRLAKLSVPPVVSLWRLLLAAFLLTAMIEFRIILHLPGSSSTISHVSISSPTSRSSRVL